MAHNDSLKDLAYCAAFAALIIVFAFVSIPVGTAGVPIVLQNAIIGLTGLILGPRRGFLTVLLFLAVGLVLPVMAGGSTAISSLGGPTAGYVVGYPFSALLAGFFAYQAHPKAPRQQVGFLTLGALAAILCQYICGAVGLMIVSKLDVVAAALAQTPFILPDLAKFAIMIIIALNVHAAFPDLLGRAHQARAKNTDAQD